MNKISVFGLTVRHWSSVMQRNDGRRPITEIIVFIILPVGCGALFALDINELSEAFHTALISFYAIFSALLLSVQMALFGIFQRQAQFQSQKDEAGERARGEIKTSLIRELNANVAFLVVLSMVAAALSLVFLILRIPAKVETFCSFYFLSLFLVSILLVVRRAYILFDVEYSV